MKNTDAEYERKMPEQSVERDHERRDTRHPCCWEPLNQQHHPVCRNAEKDEPPELVGQESLL